MLTVLAACGSSQLVKENTKVTFSYQGIGDYGHVAGQQTIVFDLPENDLYLALAGMKKGESKTITYTDIEHLHDDDLIYYYPTSLLEELGLASSIGSTLEISGNTVVVADVISEGGIEKAVLDRNALETIFPGEYQINILAVQKI